MLWNSVSQIVSLISPSAETLTGRTHKSGVFTLIPSKHKIIRSNRLSRFFGSRRVVEVKVSKELVNKQGPALRAFFLQKFIINGRIFQAVTAKDHIVYLLETEDHTFPRSPLSNLSNRGRMTLIQFINWHNPPEPNKHQVPRINHSLPFFAINCFARQFRNGPRDSPSCAPLPCPPAFSQEITSRS